jgi:hypothetical protein
MKMKRLFQIRLYSLTVMHMEHMAQTYWQNLVVLRANELFFARCVENYFGRFSPIFIENKCYDAFPA